MNWTVATYAAPWKPRAFHDVVVWHDPVNMTQDVTRSGRRSAPRIWLAGGGYMGMKDNNIVYIMKGYVDLWWSRDGGKSDRPRQASSLVLPCLCVCVRAPSIVAPPFTPGCVP